MRTYPQNSPQAAARIVALTLLADGHLCKTELDALERVQADSHLGLNQGGVQQVLHGLCEDMLAGADHQWSGTCRIAPDTLDQLLAEVDDPELQRRVMRLCLDVANADHHVTEAESIVLSAAMDQWSLPSTGASHHAGVGA